MASTDSHLSALFTIFLVVGPWLYFMFPTTLTTTTKRQPTTNPNSPNDSVAQNQQSQLDWRRRARLFNTLLIAANATYILYSLLVRSPQNVYTTLRAPLGTTGDSLRPSLLRMKGGKDGPGSLSAELEQLLERLNDPGMRAIYSRYGHDAVSSCLYCTTFEDFALYALPGPLLAYILEAFVVGFVTTRASGGDRWRKWGIGVLAVAAIAEAYTSLITPIEVKRMDVFTPMWHDRLWLSRHIFCLVLPPLLHTLPSSPLQSSPLAALPQLTGLLEMANTRIHLLKYVRGASSRASTLRANSNDWWRKEHLEGLWAREDAGVKEVAEKLGLGYGGEEKGHDGSKESLGKLRANARTGVQALKLGFIPSEHLNP